VRPRELEARLAPLEERGRELLAGAGFSGRRSRIEVELEMRYRGQAYELAVPLQRGAGAEAIRAAERAFHRAHRRAYGHERPVEETEIVTLRVRATGAARVRLGAGDGSASGSARPGSRLVWSPGRGRERHAVYARESLGRTPVAGPAVVEQDDSTVIVPRGWRLAAGEAGNVVLERGAPR
jgi:N-methylhydantoinase A